MFFEYNVLISTRHRLTVGIPEYIVYLLDKFQLLVHLFSAFEMPVVLIAEASLKKLLYAFSVVAYCVPKKKREPRTSAKLLTGSHNPKEGGM